MKTFIAVFFILMSSAAQATIGLNCETLESDSLSLYVSQLSQADASGVAISKAIPLSFGSQLAGVKLTESSNIKTKESDGWMVVKIDVNGNGKYEAEAVVYLEEEGAYTGVLFIYTKDPGNPKTEPVTCFKGA